MLVQPNETSITLPLTWAKSICLRDCVSTEQVHTKHLCHTTSLRLHVPEVIPLCLTTVSLKLTAAGQEQALCHPPDSQPVFLRHLGFTTPLLGCMTSCDGSRIGCVNVCLEHAGRGHCKSTCNAQAPGTMRNSNNTCLVGKPAFKSTERGI